MVMQHCARCCYVESVIHEDGEIEENVVHKSKANSLKWSASGILYGR